MKSSVSAQQAGEVPTVNDMIKKAMFQSYMNRNMGGQYDYNNIIPTISTAPDKFIQGLDSWINVPSMFDANSNGVNQGYYRLKQSFDFYGGKQVHTFENTGNTTITLELIEWSPRKPMMGGYAGKNSYSEEDQGTNDILINDPISLTIMDNKLNFLSQQPGYYEGMPQSSLNYQMLESGVTFVDPTDGSATHAQQPVGNTYDNVLTETNANGQTAVLTWSNVGNSSEKKPVYGSTSSQPEIKPGCADPMFRLGRPSHRITNSQYKHSKPVYLTIEPCSKATYTMYAPAFSFNGSEWNVLSNSIALTLNDINGDATNDLKPVLPNFIPLFTKFLSVRSFSPQHAHRVWSEADAGNNELADAGGSWVHTLDENYTFRYVPPFGSPNQRTFKNNRTDVQDSWDEVWYIGDATTGNEQEQNLDA